MDIVNTIKNHIRTNPISDELYYQGSYIMTKICPGLFCRIVYRLFCGRHLDLKNPKSLDEKSIWLKLNVYKKSSLVHQCTDKYLVREYVKACGCGELLNGLYGVWDSVDDIQLENLPERFVLKSNHSSGDVQICKDKKTFDFMQAKKVLRKSLRRDYSVYLAELMYADIPRKIICEEYLDASPLEIPNDYKVFCFNGKPEYIMFCTGREHGHAKYYFYDLNWQLQNITYDSQKLSEVEIHKMEAYRPVNLVRMLEYATRLSKTFPFVRVDFYEVSGRIVFGEMTFANTGGFDSYILLPEYSHLFGNLMMLDWISSPPSPLIRKDQTPISSSEGDIPKISVVIPLYNKKPYIARALDSVLAQTVQDFEIVVVNDGSTDGSGEIVRGYTDLRIRLIEQENQGVSAARNHGVDAARAELVTFLDADDEWLPQFLETILRLREKYPEAGIYSTKRCLRRRRLSNLIDTMSADMLVTSYFRHIAQYGILNNTSSSAIPKDIFQKVGGFDVNFVMYEDFDLWLRIAYSYDVAYSQNALSLIHCEASNITQRLSDNFGNMRLPFVDYYYSRPNDEVIQRVDYDDICLYLESQHILEANVWSYWDSKKARECLKLIHRKELRIRKWRAYLGTYLIIRKLYLFILRM